MWRDVGSRARVFGQSCEMCSVSPAQGKANRGKTTMPSDFPRRSEALAKGPNLSDTCPVKRILVIDDDREMVDLLAQSLAQEGFHLNTAQSGEEGIELGRNQGLDIILLDVNLPDINGFEVLRRLRRESDIPVIMLTARGEEVDRIVGLEIGADDYLPKPFSVRELVARINAILRRVAKGSPTPAGEESGRELQHGSVRMDLLTRTVRRDGQVISMTTSEFELLRALMESAGAPVHREDLSKRVFDREYSVFDRSIDNLVSALRRKLGATADGLERIKSIRNVGYVYVESWPFALVRFDAEIHLPLVSGLGAAGERDLYDWRPGPVARSGSPCGAFTHPISFTTAPRPSSVRSMMAGFPPSTLSRDTSIPKERRDISCSTPS